ncbi:MAG: AarF/UbiB family protein, partial [Eubacteriales bacterium]|nr:AarF/UbiB family protein [Eubacteriales bacterium]
MTQTAEPKTEQTSAGRLKEILSILSRHNVIAGVTPEKLCAILQDLGPTFVKLGQILSMRPDMIPARYCEALQKLRADVNPMPMDEVRRVVEGSLGMELHKAFPRFDEKPLGSASIAQVHRAELPDGSAVVVKVQREGIHDVMKSDIALLRKATGLMKLTGTGETIDLNMVLDEMWVVSQEEMNFITEAKNGEEFARLNADVTYVACPKVYRELSSQQVLVMECIDGYAITDRDALTAQGYDMKEIGEKLCVNYMKQILDDGFFHADPHPGNLRVR